MQSMRKLHLPCLLGRCGSLGLATIARGSGANPGEAPWRLRRAAFGTLAEGAGSRPARTTVAPLPSTVVLTSGVRVDAAARVTLRVSSITCGERARFGGARGLRHAAALLLGKSCPRVYALSSGCTAVCLPHPMSRRALSGQTRAWATAGRAASPPPPHLRVDVLVGAVHRQPRALRSATDLLGFEGGQRVSNPG